MVGWCVVGAAQFFWTLDALAVEWFRACLQVLKRILDDRDAVLTRPLWTDSLKCGLQVFYGRKQAAAAERSM